MGSDRNPPTFSFEWNLWNGETIDITGPLKYRNRFGLGFTTMRTTGNPKAPTPLKNRLQGARIYHWVNAGTSGTEWYPTDQIIARMASLGADVLILDPPRVGCHPRALEAVARRIEPERLPRGHPARSFWKRFAALRRRLDRPHRRLAEANQQINKSANQTAAT